MIDIGTIFSPTLLWVGVVLIAILFAIASVILIHHWTEYGWNPKTNVATIVIYLGVGILLLVTAFIVLSIYSLYA